MPKCPTKTLGQQLHSDQSIEIHSDQSIQINPSITSKIPSNSPKTARGTARARRIKRRVRKAVSFRRKSWGPGWCPQLRKYQAGFNGFGDLMLISWGFTVDLMGCMRIYWNLWGISWAKRFKGTVIFLQTPSPERCVCCAPYPIINQVGW